MHPFISVIAVFVRAILTIPAVFGISVFWISWEKFYKSHFHWLWKIIPSRRITIIVARKYFINPILQLYIGLFPSIVIVWIIGFSIEYTKCCDPIILWLVSFGDNTTHKSYSTQIYLPPVTDIVFVVWRSPPITLTIWNSTSSILLAWTVIALCTGTRTL